MNKAIDRVSSRVAIAVYSTCMVGSLVLASVPATARAAEPASCPMVSSKGLDARLTAKADQGFGPLRSFVIRTRTQYELDVPTAVQRVEHYRAMRAACASASVSSPASASSSRD